MRLGELSRALGAELRNDGANDPEIFSVASIGRASPTALVFSEAKAALAEACASSAAAVITSPDLAASAGVAKPVLVCAQPKLAFARAARLLRPPEPPSGVHRTAFVAADAKLGKDLSVEAFAVIASGVQVGRGTRIGAGAVLGAGVTIGEECRIYPRVVLYPGVALGNRVVVHAGAVLGADGFGYVRDGVTGEYLNFPQQGSLVVEDDVEIGANTTIDRGALEETRIGRGTKLDNLVHVGHNVRLGRNVVIAAQTGISGSSAIGEGAVLGGQVGLGDHAEVGDGVMLGGQAGVLPHKKLLGPGQAFWGTPAQPLRAYLKQLAGLARLSEPGKARRPSKDSREKG